MMPDLQTLLAIQERDRRILELKKGLERLPLERDIANGRLKDDEEALATVQAQVNENEIATKNLELDIETRRDSINKLKVQQFETKKNAEYQAMGHEIERYGKEITELEDKELELMEQLEGIKVELEKAKEALANTQSLVDQELAGLDDREKNSGTQIEEANQEKTDLAKNLEDPDRLETYDRIFASKGDFAVVGLEGGVCGGCHMKIPPDNVNQAKSTTELAQCINCGRIAFYVG